MIKSGDSVPEIESINTFLTTISFAVEDLFNNTYEVLNNSLEQYIASDEAIGKLGSVGICMNATHTERKIYYEESNISSYDSCMYVMYGDSM